MAQVEYISGLFTDGIESHGASAEVSLHSKVKFVLDPAEQWHYYGTEVPVEHQSDPLYFQHPTIKWPSAFVDLTTDDKFLYFALSDAWARRIIGIDLIEYENEFYTDSVVEHGASAEVNMHMSVKLIGDPDKQWHYYGTAIPAEHQSDPLYFQHAAVQWPSAFVDLTEDDQFLYYTLSILWILRVLEG